MLQIYMEELLSKNEFSEKGFLISGKVFLQGNRGIHVSAFPVGAA